MAKTYYLGHTASGHPVKRASTHDYGYTHAAVRKGWEPGMSAPAFSTNAAGAAKNAKAMHGNDVEVVSVHVVDKASYDSGVMTATEALNADIADALAPDQYDAMLRPQLDDVAGDHDIDTTGMDDTAVRAAIRAAEAAVDTSGEDDFEAGMAQELANRQAAQRQTEGHIDEAQHPMLAGKAPAPAPAALVRHNTDLPKSGDNGKCPHCGKSTRNGKNVTEYSEMSPGSQNSTDQQFTCNDCAGEWGPVVDKLKRARAPSGSSNGLKIEANREERNGVKRPSLGGKCRGIWDVLDDMGTAATAKQARERLVPAGFDKTTVMVQFYRWRKFMGIEGRQA